jgi:hypothetical protein
MSGYGFGKKPTGGAGANTGAGEGAGEPERLDLSGIVRAPVQLDPEREEAAIRRGDALGFVDRDAASSVTGETSGETAPRRRRRSAQPQVSVFIKGPKDTLDWFVEYTNQRGHRSYWETLEEFRALVEGK